MPLIALTGGIASGKSTIAARLAEHGAVIVDADRIVRDVQAPGSPVLDELAGAFGDDVIAEDGSLNRAALGAKVFGDRTQLDRLNAIVHPAGSPLWRARAAEAGSFHLRKAFRRFAIFCQDHRPTIASSHERNGPDDRFVALPDSHTESSTETRHRIRIGPLPLSGDKVTLAVSDEGENDVVRHSGHCSASDPLA